MILSSRVFLFLPFLSFTTSTSFNCQSIADDYCQLNCFTNSDIVSKSCDGPMIALKGGDEKDGEEKWRCYSPSTLNEDQTSYESGTCYCTRNSEIENLLKECADNDVSISTVFTGGEDGAACYRIPSIIKLPSNTLLTFAEQRMSDCGDNGKNNIVLRRSTDDGLTWGEIQHVAMSDGTAFSNPNPAIVYKPDGTWSILLHYDTMNNPSSTRLGKNMQTWSTDDGLTWETPVEITNFFPEASQGCMPGPAIGLQNNVEGHEQERRIYFNCHSGNAGGEHILYWSDDLGETWISGEEIVDLNECSIAFLPSTNSSVLMNCRTSKGSRGEVVFSPEGIPTGDAFYPEGLDDPGCQGSIIQKGSEGGEDFIYQSNALGDGRSHMTVKMSKDNGKSFDDGLLIWEGPTAYSQLVDGGDYVGLLFELGVESTYESIGFAIVG